MSINWKFLLKKALYCYWYTNQILFCDLLVIFMLFCRIILRCIIMAETEKVLKCKCMKKQITQACIHTSISLSLKLLDIWMYECIQGESVADIAMQQKNHGMVKRIRELRLERGLDQSHCLIKYTSNKVGTTQLLLFKISELFIFWHEGS